MHWKLPVPGCCRAGCLHVLFQLARVCSLVGGAPSPRGLVIPRCLRSLIKQFPSYRLISTVGPVSFKYLFSIKIRSQTIYWKNIDSPVRLLCSSFIYLSLKLPFREVTQCVPRAAVKNQEWKGCLFSTWRRREREETPIGSLQRELHVTCIVNYTFMDLFCSGMSYLQSLKIKCFLFSSIFVTLVSISLLALTFLLLFGYPIAASFLCSYLEKNCFPTYII